MKEIKTKIMIVILILLVVFDPSIKKISNRKQYWNSLFHESFKDEELSNYSRIRPVDSLQSALRY
jgi:hypothetical protein